MRGGGVGCIMSTGNDASNQETQLKPASFWRTSMGFMSLMVIGGLATGIMLVTMFALGSDSSYTAKTNARNFAAIKKTCPQPDKAINYYKTVEQSRIDPSPGELLTLTLATRYC